MQPVFARGNKKTIKNLLEFRKKAQQDNQYRVATRIHAIILSLEKHTSGNIANILKVNRTKIPVWINNWNLYGQDSLLEGHRSGRCSQLNEDTIDQLKDIIESGPVAYGLNTGVWTSPIIKEIVENEFGISYHPGHIRKLMKKIGFSFQRPTYKLINADPRKRNKWIRYTYPNLKKTLMQKKQ